MIDDTRSITVISTDIDSDHDGMLDYWEWQYGLNVGLNDAASNLDGDDFSNLEEFEAQTKPNDANDQPSIYIISATPGDKQVTLSVDTRGAITYDICYSDEPFVDRLNCTVASGKPTTFLNSQSSTQIIMGLENGKKYYFVASVEDKKPSNQATATPTKPDLTSGLVAHWSFDDCTAKDVSGNGHDGVINGSPQCVNSLLGKAFNFNGMTDFIEVVDSGAAFAPLDMTATVWIRPEETQLDFAGIIDKSHANGQNSGWVIQKSSFDPSSYYFGYFIPEEVRFSSAFGEEQRISTPLNKWSHLSIVKHGNKVASYLNGIKLQDFSYSSGNILPNTKSLLIGAVAGQNRFFNGDIDEIRIYNRALSDSEIQALYQKDGGDVDNSGWIQNPTTDHYYKALDNCGNWEQCETAAQAVGAHLVSIGDATENQWLVDTFGNIPYWIGFTDKESEGNWIWTNGEPVTFTNWESGQPDNNGGLGQYGWMNFTYAGGWDDCTVDCYGLWAHGGIIERTAAP